MILALDWCSGICWGLVYAIATIKGFQKRTFCIPWLCVCTNFSWELLVVIKRFASNAVLNIGFAPQFLWLLLDIGVVATWFLFDLDKPFVTKLGVFVSVFVGMYFWAYKCEVWELSAFTINLLMSVLFLIRKPGVWALKSVAIFKLLGTLAATLLNGVLYQNPLLLWLGGLILIFDVYYFLCLTRKQKEASNENK